MAGRRIKPIDEDEIAEADKAADEVIAAGSTPTNIAKIRFTGLDGEAPKHGTVTEYLEHYMKRDVEFWNPLTQAIEQRAAAEVVALQMVIAALHGDKSATNRLIERTEGKVSVDKPTPAAKNQAATARELAESVERDRQEELRAARNERSASVAAIGRIMCTPPAARIGHNSEAAPDDVTIM